MFKCLSVIVLVCTTLSGIVCASTRVIDDNEPFLRYLSNLQEGNLAQKMVRFRTQDDPSAVIDLFKVAEQRRLPRAQIYIANAFNRVDHSKFHKVDFSAITAAQLPSYNAVTHSRFNLICLMGIIHPQQSFEEGEHIASHIFRQAAAQGSVFATIVEVYNSNRIHLGLLEAAQLRPFVDDKTTATPELLYWYGESLMRGSLVGMDFYYEGLSFKHKSGLLNINFFEDRQNSRYGTFEKFCQKYFYKYEKYSLGAPYDFSSHSGGIYFLGDVVCASSRADLAAFEPKFLQRASSSLGVFDCFLKPTQNHLNRLRNLCQQFKLCFLAINGDERTLVVNRHVSGLPSIGSVSVDSRVRENERYKLVSTRESFPQELGPLVNFIEDFMMSTASPGACRAFLERLYPEP